jgi:hypothetical protein
LKHSMKDEMFKNKLRDKLRDRANSKWFYKSYNYNVI